MDIEQRLRNAARQTGLSLKRLSVQAGLPYATIHGFMVNDRQITIGSAAKLASLLALELRPKAKKGG